MQDDVKTPENSTETAAPVDADVRWPDWILISRQMPNKYEPVLLLFSTGAIRIGQHTEFGGFRPFGYKQKWRSTPTHWMPQPPDKAV